MQNLITELVKAIFVFDNRDIPYNEEDEEELKEIVLKRGTTILNEHKIFLYEESIGSVTAFLKALADIMTGEDTYIEGEDGDDALIASELLLSRVPDIYDNALKSAENLVILDSIRNGSSRDMPPVAQFRIEPDNLTLKNLDNAVIKNCSITTLLDSLTVNPTLKDLVYILAHRDMTPEELVDLCIEYGYVTMRDSTIYAIHEYDEEDYAC